MGALQVLAERDYEVVTIAGTSMGALVGGVTAAGKLEAYTEWALSLTQREVLRLLDVNLVGPGAIRAERVIGKVAEILEGALIEDLTIPFTAVATDLGARREVWFQKGPVSTAIRASVSIPGLVTPVVIDGRMLVDGGLMNPVPIEPTAAVPSDLTVAISLSGPRLGGPLEVEAATPASPVRALGAGRALEEWGDRLRASAAELLESDPVKALSTRWGARGVDEAVVHEAIEEATETSMARELVAPPTIPRWELAPRELGTMEVFNRSFDTMASLITRYRMASNPPDVLVTVPSDACRTMDFHRAAEMIEMGRRLTEEALDAAGR